jgi:hypothetical protein
MASTITPTRAVYRKTWAGLPLALMTTEKGGREAARLCVGEPQDGDEREGEWPRHKLVRMNQRFVARVEKAIASGLERRPMEGDLTKSFVPQTTDPKEMVAQIVKGVANREAQRRLWHAVLHDDAKLMRKTIDQIFEEWSQRAA